MSNRLSGFPGREKLLEQFPDIGLATGTGLKPGVNEKNPRSSTRSLTFHTVSELVGFDGAFVVPIGRMKEGVLISEKTQSH